MRIVRLQSILTSLLSCLISLLVFAPLSAQETVRMAKDPALSNDGSTLYFSWRGDIWAVDSSGGQARQLTRHPGRDVQPHVSPDGSELAFVSNRTGEYQVWVIPSSGGTPEKITYYTLRHQLQGWYPDGNSVLARRTSDRFWTEDDRFYRIQRGEPSAPEMLFNAYGDQADLSPDGDRLLFRREGVSWWRKGYHGSRAGQIWQADLNDGSFTNVIDNKRGARHPLWKPDGSGFYYVGAESGTFNLREYDFDSGSSRQLTEYNEDSVIEPCLSRDGSTIVYRHLFDFYRYHPGRDEKPQKINIQVSADLATRKERKEESKKASGVAFTDDGLEVAIISGGDVYVMDTVLREPRQVTDTAGWEREVVFGPEHKVLYFVSDREGRSDLWKAERKNPDKYWWQNREFTLTRLTDNEEVEKNISISPNGNYLAYVQGLGDLMIRDLETGKTRTLFESWNEPRYDWSPDGEWLVYSVLDNNFNNDIWIRPLDGRRKPYNLSRHPDYEMSPTWSPDGRKIAFTGQRTDNEEDLYSVWLRKEDHYRSERERTVKEALKKMNKERKKKKKKKSQKNKKKQKNGKKKNEDDPSKNTENKKNNENQEKKKEGKEKNKNPKKEKKEEEKDRDEVKIDFENLYRRVQKIDMPPEGDPDDPFWSPDGKKLAFAAKINGDRATYTVEFPDKMKPKKLTGKTGHQARWIKKNNRILWLMNGLPASVKPNGKIDRFTFKTRHRIDVQKKRRIAFRVSWRKMRDNYYDSALNNQDWNRVRKKYEQMAALAPDIHAFDDVVEMMLGELNGSHLGYYVRPKDSWEPKDEWSAETPHLGVTWDRSYSGPGIRVETVLPGSPAMDPDSRLHPDDVVRKIDGQEVNPDTNLAYLLNGPLDRTIHLTVRNKDNSDRNVPIRPMSWSKVRSLRYRKWVRDTQDQVEEASDGTLGYIHVAGMNWSSFQKFQANLYAEGHGKEGLIIDVRENGGGWTTDHLLTSLTQPFHAITRPRGGGPGYPQGRQVYASWHKPIVVLCNQNSFSNAEIFSHAIKSLDRGKLVGTPTAGGVISTGGEDIMDIAYIRLPFRGWYVARSGEDMELNGAVPDYVLWPPPGQMPEGKDSQLQKAINVLQQQIKEWENPLNRNLKKASERRK